MCAIPHCRFETRDYYVDGRKWQRNTIHTSAGSIYEERAFETVYHSSSIRKHYVQEPQDYEALWAYLNDAVILEDYDRYHRDQAELGDDGTPLVAVERTPYQQLWVQWVGLDRLGYHLADCPDRVEHTVELLRQRARLINELAAALAGALYRFSRQHHRARPSARGAFASTACRCTTSWPTCWPSAERWSSCTWTAT